MALCVLCRGSVLSSLQFAFKGCLTGLMPAGGHTVCPHLDTGPKWNASQRRPLILLSHQSPKAVEGERVLEQCSHHPPTEISFGGFSCFNKLKQSSMVWPLELRNPFRAFRSTLKNMMVIYKQDFWLPEKNTLEHISGFHLTATFEFPTRDCWNECCCDKKLFLTVPKCKHWYWSKHV